MEILEILKQCKIDSHTVTLPDIQLDRKTYLEVAKKIELIGGKWNRKLKGFLFAEDPTSLFADICNGNKRNLKKEFQFFETPDELADKLVSLAEINVNHSILEPSAGRGAIIKAILRAFPEKSIDAFELMELNRKYLQENIRKIWYLGTDFLQDKETYKYDRIIANPPFAKNQDIDHFYKMFSICKEGGRIVSVMSKHWQLSQNKKETEFREFLHLNNAQIIEIEAGAFKKSGTNIASCIVVLNK